MESKQERIFRQLTSVSGIGQAIAARAWERYGSKAVAEFSKNPEEVAQAVEGVSARIASEAQKYFRNIWSQRRKEAIADLRCRWDELFTNRLIAHDTLDRHHDHLFSRPEVTGLHVGLKREDGSFAFPVQFAIRVHVKQKLEEGHPRIISELPRELEGVPVDVLERSYHALKNDKAAGKQFVDPIEGGIAIAPDNDQLREFGTLGGIVFAGRSTRYITNRHVAGAIGTIIRQPPSGTVPDGQEKLIGEVVQSYRGDGIDCAIIKPSGPRDRDPDIIALPDHSRYFLGKLTRSDIHQTTAMKVGAVTGTTAGIVKSVDTTVDVDGLKMPGQIIVESTDGAKIIQKGDSGSLLLVEAPQNAGFFVVGLIHAAADDFSALVATHFDLIANKFGVTV